MDLILRPRVQPRLLAHVEHGGLRADEREDLGRDQPVVQHQIRLLHQPQRLDSEQLHVTRPDADKVDGGCAGWRDRVGLRFVGTFDRFAQPRLLIGSRLRL